ncbi:MAG TPA: PspA/IM30 family protein [Trichocoleus sp.]
MGLLDRLSRVVRSNFGSFVSQSEDPEKILEQALEEMQSNLIQLRQAVAQAIATQKRTERQCEQAKSMAQEWYNRAQLALQKGEEAMAREALTRRKTYSDTANAMEAQIFQQKDVVAKLKENMRLLEGKLVEAKTKKDMYIARARSAEASQRIQEMIGQVGTTGAIAAFERMEERVLNLEAQAEAVAEINAGDGLERKFAALEQEPDSIDAQLAAMKANLLAGERGQDRLPPSA